MTISEKYGKCEYFLEDNFLCRNLDRKILKIDLNNREKYLRDLDFKEITPFKILSSFFRIPMNEALKEYNASLKEEDTEVEEFSKLLKALDQNPCAFETIDGLCFADGTNCRKPHRRHTIFGYSCYKYKLDFELERDLKNKG